MLVNRPQTQADSPLNLFNGRDEIYVPVLPEQFDEISTFTCRPIMIKAGLLASQLNSERLTRGTRYVTDFPFVTNPSTFREEVSAKKFDVRFNDVVQPLSVNHSPPPVRIQEMATSAFRCQQQDAGARSESHQTELPRQRGEPF
jgi:hypothetical protein